MRVAADAHDNQPPRAGGPRGRAAALLADVLTGAGRLVVLTGAGVSADSGIPTFRGSGGLYTADGQRVDPEQLATRAGFARDPARVWAWYLSRLGLCRAAVPNAAHDALVELEGLLGDRFTLITQNVDGLHARAGSQRRFDVHGTLESCRCASDCPPAVRAIPARFGGERLTRGGGLDADDVAALTCVTCGGWLRPHVLWFDEVYDEARFRFDSSLHAVADAALVLVVGTTAATTLPATIAEVIEARGTPLIDCNPEPNLFARLAERLPTGVALVGPAADVVPALVAAARARAAG